MAANSNGGAPPAQDTVGKWLTGILATIVAGGVLSMGVWVVSNTSEGKTQQATNTVLLQSMDKTINLMRLDQKETLSLVQGAATRSELSKLDGDLRKEIDQMREKLNGLEARLGQLEGRKHR